MKILITGTAGFTLWNKIEDFNAKHYSTGRIGFHLAQRLIERGDEVVGIDNINDYYDINPVKFAKRPLFHRVNLKYARLAETGISREAEQWHTKVQSTKYPNYCFMRMNLEDREQLNQLFEQEKFDKVCNLAAQAGVRYSLENPHAYINSNVVGFINILEDCPVEYAFVNSTSNLKGV